MAFSFQPRQPKGTPTGGQFANKHHSETDADQLGIPTVDLPDINGEFVLSDGSLGNPGCDDCGTYDAESRRGSYYQCSACARDDAATTRGLFRAYAFDEQQAEEWIANGFYVEQAREWIRAGVDNPFLAKTLRNSEGFPTTRIAPQSLYVPGCEHFDPVSHTDESIVAQRWPVGFVESQAVRAPDGSWTILRGTARTSPGTPGDGGRWAIHDDPERTKEMALEHIRKDYDMVCQVAADSALRDAQSDLAFWDPPTNEAAALQKDRIITPVGLADWESTLVAELEQFHAEGGRGVDRAERIDAMGRAIRLMRAEGVRQGICVDERDFRGICKLNGIQDIEQLDTAWNDYRFRSEDLATWLTDYKNEFAA